MLTFFIRRTFAAAVIMVLISAVTFLLYFAVPQDPALLACGKACNPKTIELIHENMGLDKSLPEQYWLFLSGFFTGRDFAVGHCDFPCLGVSFDTDQMVWDTIVDRFPTTLSLTVGSLVVFLILGLAAGMLAAAKRGTVVDKTFSTASLVLSSFQIYFLGPVVVGFMVYSTGWMGNPEYVPFTEDLSGWFMGLLIPWAVLATIFTANYTRHSRSSMIEQLQEDHVRTAKAKGMPGRYVFFRYAWRGSLTPIVTILGIDIGHLLGGAVVTEFTFHLAGIGRLAVESVQNIDLPVTMGVMLVGAFFILMLNLIVDFAYAFIDPRVRLS